MSTMAGAIRRFVEGFPDGVDASQIRLHVERAYPSRWTLGTLNTHLYACCVNQPKAYCHHPHAERFLYKADGRFHIYDAEKHGPNVWGPVDEGDLEEVVDEDTKIEDLIETSLSFERDVEEHLIRNLGVLEQGLRFVSRQAIIDVGRVDILAEDAQGRRVVIELKVGEARDAAVGQIARYLGWYARADGKRPRGMLIASEFPEPVRYAAEAVQGLELVTYKVQFAFARAGLESYSF